MKPSRKLLSSIIYLSMSTPLVQAASDITISNSPASDITPSSPYMDLTNNGGTSNVNVVNLLGALGSSSVVVNTQTATGGAPFNGRITVQDSITWGGASSVTLIANESIFVAATINSVGGGSLNLNAAGSVSFDADVILSGGTSQLTVDSTGITQSAPRKLLVDGLADLDAGSGSITLTQDNKFGSLLVSGGAVTINEADSSLLQGVNAASFNLTSAGSITDVTNASVQVLGLANLNAGTNAITLGDNPGDTTNFGSLNLTGGAVSISEDSSSELAAVTASTFTLNAQGAITDTGNVAVTGAASFNSNGAAITLGDNPAETTNFGTLNFNGGAVAITEDSAMDLVGSNTAASAVLTASGALSDAGATSVAITGLGSFTGTSISLGAGTFNTGSLTFNSAGAVTISEDSSIDLTGSSIGGTTNLSALGAISDTGATSVVTGALTLSGTSISLGAGIFNASTLNFNSAGAVNIAEDSSMDLVGAITAGSANLSSTGTLSDAGVTSISITGNGRFSGTSVTLGAGLFNAGSLGFNSTGAVNISEDSSTVLSGANTAGSLNLNSTAGVTDQAGTSLGVTGNAAITAGGANSIVLDDTAFNVSGATTLTAGNGQDIIVSSAGNTFGGAVTFVASTGTLANVSVTDLTAFDLQALTVTNNLTAISGGALTDSGNLSVAGLATLGGASINIGGAGETTNFGSLRFISTGAVSIQEDSSTLLSGSGSAGSLTLASSAGITNDASAAVAVSGNANFSGTSITLGTFAGDSMNFGSLTFSSAGTVTISEDSSTLLSGTSTASILALTSAAGINNDASANLTVTNNANLSGTSITLGTTPGDIVNFGSLTFNSAGAVAITEDSSTLLTGGNTAASLALGSAAGITNAASASLGAAGNASFTGTSITLGAETGDSMNFGSLTFNSAGAVVIAEDSSTLLSGTSTAGSLTLTSAAGITNDASANLSVTGNANLSGTSIAVGTVGGDVVNFGTLTFNSAGSVSISEDSSLDLVGANTGAATSLASTGAVSDAGATSLVTGALTVSGASISLGGGIFNASTLNFNSAGAVNIAEDSSTDIVGANTAGSASIASTGAISDAGAASVDITGLGSFSGTSINLGGGTFNAGSLSFNSAGAVTIAEDSSTLLSGASTASTLVLSSTGTITNSNGAGLTVTGNASLSGAGITLGTATGDSVNFGTLTFNSAGAVTISEDSATSLTGTSTAGSLTLTSTGAIVDGANLTVSGLATFSGSSIQLGGSAQTTNFGSLNVNSAGTVSVQEDSDTQFVGANSAGVLTLTSSGTTTFTTGSTLNAATLDVLTQTVVLTGNNLVDTIAVNLASGTTLSLTGSDTIGTLTSNGGTVAGTGVLTASGGASLNGGTVSGNLLGNTSTTGSVLVSGTIGGGYLHVNSGTLTLTGTSTNTPVEIAAGASLLDSNGGLYVSAVVTNAGLLTVNAADTVLTYTQNGAGTLAGTSALTATGGATLNGGTISGQLLGNTTSTGTVLVSGSIGGGTLAVTSGTLTLTGTVNSPTTIAAAGTLKGTGLVNGNVDNFGTLAVGSMGGSLTISGGLYTRGIISLALDNPGSFERIVAGSVDLGGGIVLANTGAGLANGQMAQIIAAGSYANGISAFTTTGFSNGLLFNDNTGFVIGLAGGTQSASGYLNLSKNQTKTFLALFEDAVAPGQQNVSTAGGVVNFTSGPSNGDAQLVDALNEAIFSSPGTVDEQVINGLSPEVHFGMADYTEQSIRLHVREAEQAAPVSRKGRTQVFATVHTTSDGTDNTVTDAGYDIEMTGATAGVRYDIDNRFQVGGLLGVETGSIEGRLIDTDADGVVLGGFGSFRFNDRYQTKITAGIAYGNYTYDATRESFGGDASADGIGADAVELSLGVSSVFYEKDGLRLGAGTSLRYIGGSVDGFEEDGPGVALDVDSQDVDAVLFEIGVDLSYQLTEHLSFAGRLGYVGDLSSSDNDVTASFAATGAQGVPFTVNAAGIDDQAAILGAGLFYDINDSTRVGVTYRGEFRSDSQSSQSIGIGASYGF